MIHDPDKLWRVEYDYTNADNVEGKVRHHAEHFTTKETAEYFISKYESIEHFINFTLACYVKIAIQQGT